MDPMRFRWCAAPPYRPVVQAARSLLRLRSINALGVLRRAWWTFIEHPAFKIAWGLSVLLGLTLAGTLGHAGLLLLSLVSLSASLALALWLDTIITWHQRDKAGAVALTAAAACVSWVTLVALRALLRGTI